MTRSPRASQRRASSRPVGACTPPFAVGVLSTPFVLTSNAGQAPLRRRLVLDVFHQPLGSDLGAEDVTIGVGRDALGGAGAGCLLDRIGNERRHRAIAHPSDADAALPAIM